jgi:hypothetical protein
MKINCDKPSKAINDLKRSMRGFSILVDDGVSTTINKRINKVMNNYQSEVERLEQQLKEANEVIEYAVIESVMHKCDKDILREYLTKYKVKE